MAEPMDEAACAELERVVGAMTEGEWEVHRYDLGSGAINWQVQASGRGGNGDVIANVTDDECKRARATAHGIRDLHAAAPRLLSTIATLRRERTALAEGLREAEAYVCRVTLAANLPREAWSDACHAHTIIRSLLPTPEPKVPDVR